MWPPNAVIAASVALLTIATVGAQRTSPQFNFPQLSPQANQFGSDLFTSNGQDLASLNLQSTVNSPGAAQSSFVQMNTGPQQSSAASLLDPSFPAAPQLVAQSQPGPQSTLLQPQQPQPQQQPPQLQLQSQQAPQVRQEQPVASIQLSRPSLSLTSLSLPQQQPAQQQSNSRQLLVSAQSSVQQQQQPQSQPTLADLSTHQSSRRHQSHHQAPTQTSSTSSVSSSTSTSTSSSSSSSSSSTSSHRPGQQHHQPATTSSSQSAANQRAQAHNNNHLGSNNAANHAQSVEAARKAEATSASLAAGSGQSYSCPDSFGFFRHHKSCDKYWACANGTATLKLCGNGLMFDDSDPKRENCAYPFSVECGSDRTDLEPPISTPNCPRLYGLFSDTSNCRVFYSCWNGEASKYECPPGLAYDSEQRVCVWADLVDRCDQSEVSDGFVCPDPTEVDQPGHYTRHAHPTDCRKFYVCIDGVARPYGCSFGTVFNVDSLQCDEPESVSGCEKYYGDLDPKLAKKLARENAQQSGNVGSSASTRGASGTASTSN